MRVGRIVRVGEAVTVGDGETLADGEAVLVAVLVIEWWPREATVWRSPKQVERRSRLTATPVFELGHYKPPIK